MADDGTVVVESDERVPVIEVGAEAGQARRVRRHGPSHRDASAVVEDLATRVQRAVTD